ncbi:hypothetical protein Tco_0452926 [Tanacetum coccineum]
MHTTMVPAQVKTLKIQARVQVSRPEELRRHLQHWKSFGRLYFVVFILVRNIQKKDVIQYPRFTKLIVADLMKKLDSIPSRLEENYHSIKDDIPLEYKEYEQVFVGVDVPTIQPQPVVSTQGTYRATLSAHRSPTLTTYIAPKKKRKQVSGETSSPRNSLKVTIKQKKPSTTPIPPPSDDRERDEIVEATHLSPTLHKTTIAAKAQENVAKVQEKLAEEDIEKMVKGEEVKESYASEFADSMLNDDDDDSGTRIEPGSHKEHPKNIDDDDDETEKEKKDDKKNDEKENDDEKKDETGNMQTRKEKMQTPILSPTRSPRKNLSSDKTLSQELTETVSPSTATTSKSKSKSKAKSNARSTSITSKILPGSITGMCRRRCLIRKHLKSTFVTNEYF